MPDGNVAVGVASEQFAHVIVGQTENVFRLFLLLKHANLLLQCAPFNVPEEDVTLADADERVLLHWMELNCQDSITGRLRL